MAEENGMFTEFQTFDLLFEVVGDAYRARVLDSPTGSASVDFSLPFDEQEIEALLLRLAAARQSMRQVDSPAMAAVRDFGARLFESVFKEDLQVCWESSLALCTQRGQGLRLLLRLGETPRLSALPWEFLYHRELDRFYALSRQTPVVRMLTDFPDAEPPLQVAPPLRMLVVLSSPQGYPPLDTAREQQNLQQALTAPLQHGRLVVGYLTEATVETLQHRLRRDPVHILHFIGHGGFDEQTGEGVLLFEDAEGKPHPLAPQYLGTLLRDNPSLRLVVLNACEGGRSSWQDPFSGVAQSLIRQGVPAVVAMQTPISDQAALVFSREFYAAIADGYPVAAALSEARKAMYTETHSPAWGIPVLYLRAPEDRIFQLPPPEHTSGFWSRQEVQAAKAVAAGPAASESPPEGAAPAAPPRGKYSTSTKIVLGLVALVGLMIFCVLCYGFLIANTSPYVPLPMAGMW